MAKTFAELAKEAVGIWKNTPLDAVETAAEDAERYRELASLPGMNLHYLSLEYEDPLDFVMHRVVLKTLIGADKPFRLGDHEDIEFIKDNMLDAYCAARDKKETCYERINSSMDGSHVVYDRLILPERTEALRARWAVVLFHPRLILPATDASALVTNREHDVLSLVLQGQTAREIAEALNLSPKSVEHRIADLKRKFRARNLPHLVSLAVSAGLK